MIYIAVDCGKYDTKTACFNQTEVKRSKFRTKLSPGIFEDDMLKKGTMIVQVDGAEIYTFGYGAGAEPAMETTKKTEVHRTATLAAIAQALGPGKHAEVCVAIGVPLDICANPAERMAYKEFILGKDGDTHTVRWKKESEGPVYETVFTIKKRYVYPEGCGVLWLYPERCIGSAAVIDIGNLNTNCIYAESLNPEDEMCFTGELGGKVLIAGLAGALSADLGSRVAETMVAQALLKKGEERRLVSAKANKEVEERSRKIIADYALSHVKMIKQQCDVHHWPLDFCQIVAVGGTSKLLQDELKEVFGETLFIPENSEYANAEGFLRRMCAGLGVDIQQQKNTKGEKAHDAA